MKSEELKNLNELENTEKTEFENSEKFVDSVNTETEIPANENADQKTVSGEIKSDETIPETSQLSEISKKAKTKLKTAELTESVHDEPAGDLPVTGKVEQTNEISPDTEKQETPATIIESGEIVPEFDETTENAEQKPFIKVETEKASVEEDTITDTFYETDSDNVVEKAIGTEEEEEEEEEEEQQQQQVTNQVEETINDEIKLTEADQEIISEDTLTVAPSKTKVKKVTQQEIEEIASGQIFKGTDDLLNEEKKARTDYSKYSQVELVNALRELIESPDDDDIKYDVDAIKSVFYKKKNEKIEHDLTAFIEEGGMEEEFVPEEDPYENDIRELLKKYSLLRKEHNKLLDSEKEDNLRKKLEIIEKIKSLINNEESINKTFNEFRELQREWREIGPVPQAKMKNLWDTYHFHVENFYDYIKINRELRDLDLKRNLESKIKLCEAAEELLVEPSIIKAFNTLQKYHEQWREIGPVPRDNKDDVWERFKMITAIINKKHQDFFESKKTDQKKNYEAKVALCEKVEEICNSEIDSYKEWDAKSKELVELQKVWRTIGFAPKKENNKIYERFRNACDEFFNKKRQFYSKNKEIQQNNLQQKIDLCIQAEALRENTDWKKATQDFINIQKKWKEIGPVPRKHSDIVWKRFRAACDFFFDKKSEHFSDVDTEQIDNLKLKEGIIAELENFKPTDDVNENLRLLKDIQRRWTEIGHVPFKKKDAVQNKFREVIGKLFDQLSINEDKRNLLKFKTKISSFSETSRGQNKMRLEREKYINKLKQLENDLVLLDNNIGFFAKSKNAESLIEDVKKKIEDTRQKIETLKEKIRVIDEMED